MTLGFDDWRACADRLLVDNYCITLSDAGPSDEDLRRYWNDGDTPEEYVDWFAEKYDLTHVNEVSWGGAVRLSR